MSKEKDKGKKKHGKDQAKAHSDTTQDQAPDRPGQPFTGDNPLDSILGFITRTVEDVTENLRTLPTVTDLGGPHAGPGRHGGPGGPGRRGGHALFEAIPMMPADFQPGESRGGFRRPEAPHDGRGPAGDRGHRGHGGRGRGGHGRGLRVSFEVPPELLIQLVREAGSAGTTNWVGLLEKALGKMAERSESEGNCCACSCCGTEGARPAPASSASATAEPEQPITFEDVDIANGHFPPHHAKPAPFVQDSVAKDSTPSPTDQAKPAQDKKPADEEKGESGLRHGSAKEPVKGHASRQGGQGQDKDDHKDG